MYDFDILNICMNVYNFCLQCSIHMISFYILGIKNDPEQRGVIPNSFEHIFQHISRSENQQYLIRASYLEIYMVGDILSANVRF